MNNLVRIIRNFPLFLSILSFAGITISYLNLFTYYNRFGINISEYISLSEVIILSIPDLILIGLSATLHYLFIHSFLKSMLNKNSRLNFYIVLAFILLGTILSIILIIFNEAWLTHSFVGRYFSSNIVAALIVSIVYITTFVNTRSIRYLQRLKEVQIHFISFSLALLALLILIVINNYGSPTTYLVKNKNIQLNFQDKTDFRSSDSCWLLGRTEKYYFIYNINKKKTIIRPVSDITQVTLDWKYFQ